MTRIEEIKLRAVAPTCAPYSTIRADVDYLLAENKRMREALKRADEELEPDTRDGRTLQAFVMRARNIIRAALKGPQS